MIWFNPAKRHGFIRTDEGERLRVDEKDLAHPTLVDEGSDRAEDLLEILAG